MRRCIEYGIRNALVRKVLRGMYVAIDIPTKVNGWLVYGKGFANIFFSFIFFRVIAFNFVDLF